ncbi:MAG: hypothetical protein R3F01_04240 [Lysobacteraceae bacterium]
MRIVVDALPSRPAGLCVVVLLLLFVVAASASAQIEEPELTLHADLFTGQNQVNGGGVIDAVGFDGRHLFTSNSREEGSELWVSDGSAAGTRLMADICPGKCSGSPRNFHVLGSRLYFSADDGVHGTELWQLSAGSDVPQMVADINPGVEGSSPGRLKVVSLGGGFSAVFFVATRHDVGRELFRLAGFTPVLDTDILPGPASSSPSTPVNLGDGKLLTVIRNGINQTVPAVLHYPPSYQPPATLDSLTGFPAPSSSHFLDTTLHGISGSRAILLRRGLGSADDELWTAQFDNGGSTQVYSGSVREAVASDGLLYFSGSDDNGSLKVSDGTLAGTKVIGPARSTRLVAWPGIGIGFIAQNGAATTNLEPFASRGTAAETVPLPEIVPGDGGLSSSTNTDLLTVPSSVNGLWLAREEELWVMGSTSALKVASFPGLADEFIRLQLHPSLSASVLFAATGGEPFIAVPEVNGARKLAEVRSDVGHSLVRPHALVNDRIVATAITDSGAVLSKIVSLPVAGAGEPLILDENGGSPSVPVPLGDRLLLRQFSRLISTDGSVAGTVSFDTPRILLAEGCYARFDDAVLTVYEGESLDIAGVFHTDGTLAGSFDLVEMENADFAVRAPCTSLQRSFATLGGDLFFTGTLAYDASPREYELLRYNGESVSMVVNIDGAGRSSTPLHYAVLGDRILFAADDGLNGRELWETDGTAQGTRLLRDIVPGAGSSQPEQLRRVGNRVIFSARTPFDGRELWVTDGSAAGTQLLRDIAPGNASSIADNTSMGNFVGPITDRPLVFDVRDGLALVSAVAPQGAPDFGCPLFLTDGTPAGTRCAQDRDLPLPMFPLSPASVARFTEGGDIVFFGADQVSGEEVRVLRNGAFLDIPGGDLRPGPRGSAPGIHGDAQQDGGLMVVGNDAWFAADDGVHGIELYRLTVPPLPTQIFADDFEN